MSHFAACAGCCSVSIFDLAEIAMQLELHSSCWLCCKQTMALTQLCIS